MKSRSLAKSDVSIKEAILGKDYELSLVYCKNALSQKLNRIYRGKDRPTNVLAFPLSKNSGEIFINTEYLKGFSTLELYVHALLHLKGMRHGAKMESEERKFLKLFNGEAHQSRDRYRITHSQGGNRRGSSRLRKNAS